VCVCERERLQAREGVRATADVGERGR
jgi:hypothetical protein